MLASWDLFPFTEGDHVVAERFCYKARAGPRQPMARGPESMPAAGRDAKILPK